MARSPFMRPPDDEVTYHVGDSVDVFCDHEKMANGFAIGPRVLLSR